MRPGSQAGTSILVILLLLTARLSSSLAQTVRSKTKNDSIERKRGPSDTFDPTEIKNPESEMRAVFERYSVDRGSLMRSYPVFFSPARQARFKQFYSDWLASLDKLDFDAMSQDGKVDYVLFKNHLESELRQLDILARQLAEIEPLIP